MFDKFRSYMLSDSIEDLNYKYNFHRDNNLQSILHIFHLELLIYNLEDFFNTYSFHLSNNLWHIFNIFQFYHMLVNNFMDF